MYVFSRPRAPARCCGAWLLVTAAVAALAGAAVPAVTAASRPDHPAPFADLLVAVCAVATLGASGWLWLVTTEVAVRELLGRPPSGARPPGPLRTLVLAACGTAVLAAPAVAAAPPPPAALVEREPRSDDATGRAREPLAGLPLPDRATGGAGEAPAAAPTHRVRRGDSLWAIATARLGRAATAAEVTAYWHRVHAANAAVIGPDPDLIRPGQLLVLPPARPS